MSDGFHRPLRSSGYPSDLRRRCSQPCPGLALASVPGAATFPSADAHPTTVPIVPDFALPDDIAFNRGPIRDPATFARDAHAASWLYLCGEEWATMDGGMSYADVQAAVPESEVIVSDAPGPLDVDFARQHLDALDRLPRPTLVTC